MISRMAIRSNRKIKVVYLSENIFAFIPYHANFLPTKDNILTIPNTFESITKQTKYLFSTKQNIFYIRRCECKLNFLWTNIPRNKGMTWTYVIYLSTNSEQSYSPKKRCRPVNLLSAVH